MLGQEQKRHDRSEEGLQVRKERGPRGPDAIDRREPHQVRQDEGPEDGEGEAEPQERPEVELLLANLPAPEQEEDDGDHEQDDGADAKRRIAPHQRRDRDRVGGPRESTEHGECVTLDVPGQTSTRSDADESDSRERDDGCTPEAAAEALDPDSAREERREDRERPEEQCDRRRGREAQRVDEAQLVSHEHCDAGGNEREVPAGDRERALPRERNRREQQGGGRVADRRVGERVETLVEDVLRDGEVERPEQDGREQEEVGGAPLHRPRLSMRVPVARALSGSTPCEILSARLRRKRIARVGLAPWRSRPGTISMPSSGPRRLTSPTSCARACTS